MAGAWFTHLIYPLCDDMKSVAEEPPEPVAMEESERQALPTGYVLSQNYPNPFNPVTTIAYELSKASDLTLTVYTLTGQKVALLVNTHQEVGHHAVMFNGYGFANGVYLYRLEAGSFVETKRMLLLE